MEEETGILFPICPCFSGTRSLLEINDHNLKSVYLYMDAIIFTNLVFGFSLIDILNNFEQAETLSHCVSCQDGLENLFDIFCSTGMFLWTHNSLARKCLLSLLTKTTWTSQS